MAPIFPDPKPLISADSFDESGKAFILRSSDFTNLDSAEFLADVLVFHEVFFDAIAPLLDHAPGRIEKVALIEFNRVVPERIAMLDLPALLVRSLGLRLS